MSPKKQRIRLAANPQALGVRDYIADAYIPVPGLAVHRKLPPSLNKDDVDRSKRWRQWRISHVQSGLMVDSAVFKRLRDAYLACKFIASMAPWGESVEQVRAYTKGRVTARKVRFIMMHASNGLSESEIACRLLERELDDCENQG